MEYYAVVVLYNKKIQESITVCSLLKLKTIIDIRIIVIDNSIYEYVQNNKNYFWDSQLQYHSMGGNVGLSKAYNYALSLLENKLEDNIVIWFDDDTAVTQEYFKCLTTKAYDLRYDVFVPVIYGQNGIIYSPNEKGCLKGHYIKSPDQKISEYKFNAINSCLAVRLKVYQNYRYDEELFMDCVDTKLFDDFRKMKLKFCILPVEIVQNFFQRGRCKDVQKYWSRFEIRIKDTMYYAKLNGFSGRICGVIRVVGWSLVYGIKLRSPIFCFRCLKQMVKMG